MFTLDAIARPSGGFAMVAMDQRDSLRSMFDGAGLPGPPRAARVEPSLDGGFRRVPVAIDATEQDPAHRRTEEADHPDQNQAGGHPA